MSVSFEVFCLFLGLPGAFNTANLGRLGLDPAAMENVMSCLLYSVNTHNTLYQIGGGGGGGGR